MPTPAKKSKTFDSTTLQAWTCTHDTGKSRVEAYNAATGKRETVLETFPTDSMSAEAIAEFIATAVNNFDKREHLIEEMQAALEICLECDGLDWAAEHDADAALRRAGNRT
jgi:hypothetical protein